MILVCENNGFAEFTPRSAHTIVERVTDVVAPYGLARATVDGNDVVAVRRAPSAASLEARRVWGWPVPARVPDAPAARPLRGRPATLREALAQEVAAARPDPAPRAARRRRAGSADAAARLEQEARDEVEEAIRFARARSPR